MLLDSMAESPTRVCRSGLRSTRGKVDRASRAPARSVRRWYDNSEQHPHLRCWRNRTRARGLVQCRDTRHENDKVGKWTYTRNRTIQLERSCSRWPHTGIGRLSGNSGSKEEVQSIGSLMAMLMVMVMVIAQERDAVAKVEGLTPFARRWRTITQMRTRCTGFGVASLGCIHM